MAAAQVIVIGAGPAGIAAARELKALGVKQVIVLEAAGRVGGRVLNSGEIDDPKIRELTRGSVELGPSFIHGDCENEFLEYLKANGARIRPGIKTKTLAWPNYFYLGKEGKLLSGEQAEQDADIQRMLEVYEMLDGLDAKLIPEESLLQYFVRMGVPSRVLDMADAIFANDYGADMSRIGIKETVQEQHAWKYGEDYLILEGCTYSDVFRDMARVCPLSIPLPSSSPPLLPLRDAVVRAAYSRHCRRNRCSAAAHQPWHLQRRRRHSSCACTA